VSEKTAVQRIKELDQERATLFEQAKEEALRRANQAVEDLNSLGLKYRLVPPTAAEGNKGAGKPQETGSARADKKRPARSP
jgi:vacuolar-type H+-ATPase subunit H